MTAPRYKGVAVPKGWRKLRVGAYVVPGNDKAWSVVWQEWQPASLPYRVGWDRDHPPMLIYIRRVAPRAKKAI